MSHLPADLDTEHQPPMSLPFAHFVIGLVLLLGGGAVAGLGPFLLDVQPSNAGLVHLLLAGWIGLTIMGAMTLFVPVWSGTGLYSYRAAVVSLWLVVLGLLGLVTGFFSRQYAILPVGATVLLTGFWVFVANIGLSLPSFRDLDVTEAHFVLALTSLVIATILGWLLAASLGGYQIAGGILDPSGLLMAHLTFTVFGFVLSTIVGALYQLGEMFTQSSRGPMDDHLTHVESAALPLGILALAIGRYTHSLPVARFGAGALLLGVLTFGVFLLRRVWLARVRYGPMLTRYGLVGISMLGWVALTGPRWLANPIDYFARFGSPRATHLLFVGVFAFTIVGTFYHVVPFVVWYNAYRDRLGYEQVPMMDDLYNSRLARAELVFLAGGLLLLVAAEFLDASMLVRLVGGNVLGIGFLLFAANMTGVVWHHRPETFREIPAVLAGHGE